MCTAALREVLASCIPHMDLNLFVKLIEGTVGDSEECVNTEEGFLEMTRNVMQIIGEALSGTYCSLMGRKFNLSEIQVNCPLLSGLC